MSLYLLSEKSSSFSTLSVSTERHVPCRKLHALRWADVKTESDFEIGQNFQIFP